MRAYTLAMLDKIAGQGHPVVENGIIEWTNNKVIYTIFISNDLFIQLKKILRSQELLETKYYYKFK